MLSREATNIYFSLTRLGLEPTIYHTQGEHTNHYYYTPLMWLIIFNVQNMQSITNMWPINNKYKSVFIYFRVHYSDAVLIVTPLSAKTKRNNTNIYTVTNLYGCWIKFYSLVNLICLRPRIKNVCVSGCPILNPRPQHFYWGKKEPSQNPDNFNNENMFFFDSI
jgi:hypothetical protein